MKRIFSIVFIIIIFVGISVALFVTGKEHEVFFSNPSIEGMAEDTQPDITVVIDNNSDSEMTVKVDKRKVFVMKGLNHKITLTYTSETGEEKTLTKEFKLPLRDKDITINLSNLVFDKGEYLEISDIIPEEPEPEDEEPVSTDVPAVPSV